MSEGVWLFHLTVMFRAAVLEWMSMLNTGATKANNGEVAANGLLQRWREFGTPSWRKVGTLAGGLLAVALGYHVMFGQNGLTSYEQKRAESKSLDHQMQSLQHENEMLKDHVDALANDPDAIEHQARETMHYTRSGEVIYGFHEKPKGAQLQPLN